MSRKIKVKFWTVFIAAMFLVNSEAWAKSIRIDPYGYFWFRYEHEIEQNTQTVKKNNFTIPRGYLQFKAKYEENIEGHLTVDISADKKLETESSSGTTLEASLHEHGYKDNTRVRLKYAYVAVVNIIPDAKLQLGLQKNYFGNIDLWDYATVHKAMEDAEGVMESADLGVVLNGKVLGGADYQMGIYNGSGYSQAVDESNITEKCALLSVGFLTFPGIYLRGSYRSENEGAGKYSGIQKALIVQYDKDPFRFMVERLNADTAALKKSGTDLFGAVKMGPSWQLKARTYAWDPDASIPDDAYTYLIFGLNYWFAPDLLLQFDYRTKNYENAASNGEVSYIAQAKWSF